MATTEECIVLCKQTLCANSDRNYITLIFAGHINCVPALRRANVYTIQYIGPSSYTYYCILYSLMMRSSSVKRFFSFYVHIIYTYKCTKTPFWITRYTMGIYIRTAKTSRTIYIIQKPRILLLLLFTYPLRVMIHIPELNNDTNGRNSLSVFLH